MNYVQPGEKIWVVLPFHRHRPSAARAVVVERLPHRDLLGPDAAAFRYRGYRDNANESWAMAECHEGTHWIRDSAWTNRARDALLVAYALAALPNT